MVVTKEDRMPQMPEHHDENHPVVISRNARAGLALFVIYFAFYAGYLLLNVFSPRTMSDTVIPLGGDLQLTLGGMNLAVGYGIALILMAMFLAMVYVRMTRPRKM
jgi:hypothetical protein